MTSTIEKRQEFQRSLRRLTAIGTAGIALFGATVGIWGVSTMLSGAVVASGQFVIDGNAKKIQHPTGGIVGELRVRDGDRVGQDAILIRLDDTMTRANLEIVVKQLNEFAARRSRLKAERDGHENVGIPPEFAELFPNRALSELVAAEQGLFQARRTARDGQKAQFAKRVGQLRDEIKGLAAQQAALDQQAVLIREELGAVRALYDKSLVSLNRRAALEREIARLEGQKGQLTASVAQSEGKIAEIDLQIMQIDQALLEEVLKELSEIERRSSELIERRITAEDQLRRTDIRSPIAGFVHQLMVHTVGGVITPAELLMLIVPENEALQVEARINPPDIDQIALGHSARVKIHAFNQRTTPELAGEVSRVSPDTIRDQQTGAIFYLIRIAVPATELSRLAPSRVTVGMQADVFVKTDDRTPLQYIVKPLMDQVAKAFRER